jgi:predicted small lipoprotein YifL
MEPMRRTLLGILAALVLLAATACTVTHKDPDYVPPAPLPALEQLKQAPLADAAGYATGQDILSFVTADRNVVCSLTSARGGHVNLPYEPNGYADPANNKLATVPVAHCELAVYPAPDAKDITDDCGGTGLGYLGGAALLTPQNAGYGECRSGVTQQEAEHGPRGSRNGPISQLPVLDEGQNLERNGLRCSAYNGGVACGNVSAGVAFFVSRDRYELISDAGKTADQRPSGTPKTP